jgi:hypothetical protein
VHCLLQLVASAPYVTQGLTLHPHIGIDSTIQATRLHAEHVYPMGARTPASRVIQYVQVHLHAAYEYCCASHGVSMCSKHREAR